MTVIEWIHWPWRDPRGLPVDYTAGEPGDRCDAICPHPYVSGYTLTCTRRWGHFGRCAHGDGRVVIAVWVSEVGRAAGALRSAGYRPNLPADRAAWVICRVHRSHPYLSRLAVERALVGFGRGEW